MPGKADSSAKAAAFLDTPTPMPSQSRWKAHNDSIRTSSNPV